MLIKESNSILHNPGSFQLQKKKYIQSKEALSRTFENALLGGEKLNITIDIDHARNMDRVGVSAGEIGENSVDDNNGGRCSGNRGKVARYT